MGFTLPSLPSFQSVRSLLDTEPQVLYPSSATNTHSNTNHNATANSGRPPPSPSRGVTNGAGRVLPPVPDVWDRGGGIERGRGKGRRQSIAASGGGGPSNGLGLHLHPQGGSGVYLDPRLTTPGPIPGQGCSRPTHRRSQSATPAPHVNTDTNITSPLPLGRLTEYSRNSLASISALSLPTLAEIESDGRDTTTAPAEYLVQDPARSRRSSKASIYTSSANVSFSLPSSPLRPTPTQSLPSPLPLTLDVAPGLSVPPPTKSRNQLLVRPPSTPRAWSSVDIRHRPTQGESQDRILRSPDSELQRDLGGRKNLTRHASYTQANGHVRGHGKGKESISQVSDVAVLATWSFPTCDLGTDTTSFQTGVGSASNNCDAHRPPQGQGQGVSTLAERLKSLTTLQVNLPSQPNHATAAAPPPSPSQNQGLSTVYAPTVLSTPRNLNHPNVHRSSHSSPNILASARKGLRQPIPLGSGVRLGSSTNLHLSSSPGSLLSSSDKTDTSSPTSSLHSLPAQPIGMPNLTTDNLGAVSVTGGFRGWRMPWGSRRNSIVSQTSSRSLVQKGDDDLRERSFEDDGEVVSCGSDGEDVEERYINFDEI